MSGGMTGLIEDRVNYLQLILWMRDHSSAVVMEGRVIGYQLAW
jgi:hypothetical protein